MRKDKKLKLIDTHAHLDLSEFDRDREEVIQRAREAGLVHIVTIGIDVKTSERAIKLAGEYDFISAAIGFHPHDAKHLTQAALDRLRDLGRAEEVVGFGEIGLDFYRDHSPRLDQREGFEELIRLGLELKLPIIIHDRDAHEEVYKRLAAARAGQNGGVIHCFSGDYNLARRFIDLGFHISIPGTVTFPKADTLRKVVDKLPLDALLIETDAPFLAPLPHRGKRNEPAYVKLTAAEVARVKKLSLEEIASITTANAQRLFGLPNVEE